MKVEINVYALALLTLIFTWGLSGCSKNAPSATTKTAVPDKETETTDDHAQHALAHTASHHGQEHGNHNHHEHHGHTRDEHHHHGAGRHHGNEPAPEAKVKVGHKVPDFSLQTLDGLTVHLSDVQMDERRTKSGVVVLTYWCSTCHSCRDVEHLLAKLCKDYEGQAALMALDANADETAESVAAFLKMTGLELPVVLDKSGQTADLFGINKTTTTVVVDSDGVLRYCGQFRHKGGGSAEEALKAVLAGNEVAIKTTPHNGCPIMRE
jgi:cytochrome c biogenesis protein CcmG/thiol:disulfide interchange protein DsbE